MSVYWWLFWFVAIAVFFAVMTPVPRSRARQRRETPMEILRRRYAEGEITTAEYEERQQRLEGGHRDGARPPPPPSDPPPAQPLAH